MFCSDVKSLFNFQGIFYKLKGDTGDDFLSKKGVYAGDDFLGKRHVCKRCSSLGKTGICFRKDLEGI